MEKIRPNWDVYFIQLAHMIATRATCNRANVGAVIVRDKRILSTGYNGSPAGAPHCDDIGHEMVEGHCVRTIHAEMNAIVQAAKNGVSIDNSEIYVTHFPCYICFKQIANAGVKVVYYDIDYRVDNKCLKLAHQLGIALRHIPVQGKKEEEDTVVKEHREHHITSFGGPNGYGNNRTH